MARNLSLQIKRLIEDLQLFIKSHTNDTIYGYSFYTRIKVTFEGGKPQSKCLTKYLYPFKDQRGGGIFDPPPSKYGFSTSVFFTFSKEILKKK